MNSNGNVNSVTSNNVTVLVKEKPKQNLQKNDSVNKINLKKETLKEIKETDPETESSNS